MHLISEADPTAAARAAATYIAAYVNRVVSRQPRCVLALSGGTTGTALLHALREMTIPWEKVHIVQVDERVAPSTEPSRNGFHLQQILVANGPLLSSQFLAMPVENVNENDACRDYEAQLKRVAGVSVLLDLVHLGLGDDGHTASLVPDDPVLRERQALVAMTAPYRGFRRMTLTYPILNRARRIVWLTTGADKAPMLRRFMTGDTALPASHIRRSASLLFTDRAATDGLTPSFRRYAAAE